MRRALGVALVVGLAGVAAVIGSRAGRDPAAPSVGRATEHARVEPVIPPATGDPLGDHRRLEIELAREALWVVA